jgi:hypothetical protein
METKNQNGNQNGTVFDSIIKLIFLPMARHIVDFLPIWLYVNLEFFIHIPMPATYSCDDVCSERERRGFLNPTILRPRSPPNRYSNHIAVIKMPQCMIFLLTRTVVITPIQILVLSSQNSTFPPKTYPMLET